MGRAFGHSLAAAVTAALFSASAAMASSITPGSAAFGEIQNVTSTPVTFGGTGIPTNPTAFSRFFDTAGSSILLGLTAHQRFSNPPLTSDEASRSFTAQAGANDGFGGPGTASTWNFAVFVEASGPRSIADWGVELLFDLDPGADTLTSELGVWDLGTTLAAFQMPAGQLFQTTQNATFGFLGVDNVAGGITAPAFTAFDPLVNGEYTFALRIFEGVVAINVNVVGAPVAPIPVPAALPLLAGGLGLLGLMGWRRRNAV